MKDYFATLRIQQGRLKAAMQELGIETVAELSRRSGVSQHEIGKLLNFRQSARRTGRKKGEWRTVTVAVCKALGSDPEELFPQHLDHEISTNRITAFVEHAQLSGSERLQLLPGEDYQRIETEQVVDEVLGTLTDRERGVLKARFWEAKSLSETSRELHIGKERVRQIEAKALRRLRHPDRIEKLKEVCPFSGERGNDGR